MNTHLLLLACLVETLEIICAKDQCKMTVKNVKFTMIGSAAEKQQRWASDVSFWREKTREKTEKIDFETRKSEQAQVHGEDTDNRQHSPKTISNAQSTHDDECWTPVAGGTAQFNARLFLPLGQYGAHVQVVVFIWSTV